MKVKELIESLRLMDPELPVVIDGYEGGVDDATICEETEIALNQHLEWYYGAHEITSEPYKDIEENSIKTKAVYITKPQVHFTQVRSTVGIGTSV